MEVKIYGLKNCSTCSKARRWLKEQNINAEFIDVKENGPTKAELLKWSEQLGWDKLINKRSQTWRQLDEHLKEKTQQDDLVLLVQDYPSLMKRPLLVCNQSYLLGFSESSYQDLLG